MSAATAVAVPASRRARLLDFIALGKPRVVVLIMAAVAAGYYLGAQGPIEPSRLVSTLLGTALAAAGSLGLNMLLERDIDARMQRTSGRPLPAARLTPDQALAFGVLNVAAGLGLLSLLVDPVAGMVTAATVALYLFAYTPMKRSSALCTIVGAFPGALPPLTGWAAARGTLDEGAWSLFVIFFLWQLPHSLAIARMYRDDYARGGIQMLPVVDRDGPRTGRQTVLHSLGLVPAGALPTLTGVAGPWAMAAGILLGLGMLGFSLRLLRDDGVRAARRLFLASLAYLPLLLLALALDRA